MKKIFLYTHGGSFNHGCEAIIRGTIDIFNFSENIALFSLNPHYDKMFGLSKIVRIENHSGCKCFSLKHLIACFNKYILKNVDAHTSYLYSPVINYGEKGDLAISTGGDMYCYNLHQWITNINRVLRKKGVITVLWGCSIEHELINEEMLKDLQGYRIICCRESLTYQTLKDRGLNNIKLYPDPAFVLGTQSTQLSHHFNSNNIVGINLSTLQKKFQKNAALQICIERLLRHIIDNTDMNIALISHVNGEHEYEQDYNYLKEVSEIIKCPERIFVAKPNLNCCELKYIISQCRLFIGARTHATIAAYSKCIPTLALGYSVKAKGIAKDIFGTYKNYVLEVQKLENKDDLVNAFYWILENENEIKKHLQEFMPGYIEKAWQAGEEIKKLFEETK